jgi:hypothetical protein
MIQAGRTKVVFELVEMISHGTYVQDGPIAQLAAD